MSESRKTHEGGLFFVTLTVAGWVNLFTRPVYCDEVIANLEYCQKKEGLQVYAYVLMTNHLHMIVSRDDDKDLNELLGRFKSFTSKRLIKLIEENPEESRKEWLLYLFRYFAKMNKQYNGYHLWQYTNYPTELISNDVIDQKEEYIHDNPVRAGIVIQPEHYYYSSACEESPLKVLPL